MTMQILILSICFFIIGLASGFTFGVVVTVDALSRKGEEK